MFGPYRSINYKHSQRELQSVRQKQYIETLEKKLEERAISIPSLSQNFPRFSERITPDKKAYASDLTKQIEEKKHKADLEKQQKTQSGFTEDLQVYPNRPQTPQQERRERERIKMRVVKEALEEQIISKESYNKLYRSKELEADKLKNLVVLQREEEERKEKVYAKNLEKEILISSWENAHKSREIVSQIDCIEYKGFNPRSRSIAPKDGRVSPFKVSSDEVITSEGTLTKEITNTDYQTKSQLIKNEIEKKYQSSYQFKIKKMLKEAKSQRKVITKSLSPCNLADKKKISMRTKFDQIRRFNY